MNFPLTDRGELKATSEVEGGVGSFIKLQQGQNFVDEVTHFRHELICTAMESMGLPDCLDWDSDALIASAMALLQCILFLCPLYQKYPTEYNQ